MSCLLVCAFYSGRVIWPVMNSMLKKLHRKSLCVVTFTGSDEENATRYHRSAAAETLIGERIAVRILD